MKRFDQEKIALLREIQKCSGMLQRSLVTLYRKCGKKGCRCERGGEVLVYCLFFKEEGVTQMVYVPASRYGRGEEGDGGVFPVLGTWCEAS